MILVCPSPSSITEERGYVARILKILITTPDVERNRCYRQVGKKSQKPLQVKVYIPPPRLRQKYEELPGPAIFQNTMQAWRQILIELEDIPD